MSDTDLIWVSAEDVRAALRVSRAAARHHVERIARATKLVKSSKRTTFVSTSQSTTARRHPTPVRKWQVSRADLDKLIQEKGQ